MPRDRLYSDAKKVADAIRKAESILIVTHIDADGISAGAVAASALELLGRRRGDTYDIIFAKKLDQEVGDGYPGYRSSPQLPDPYHIDNRSGTGEDIANYQRPGQR